jgi:hypothetical protein
VRAGRAAVKFSAESCHRFGDHRSELRRPTRRARRSRGGAPTRFRQLVAERIMLDGAFPRDGHAGNFETEWKAASGHGLGKCATKWSRSRAAAARVSSFEKQSWHRHARSSFESSSSHARRRSSSTRRHCGLQYSTGRPRLCIAAVGRPHVRQVPAFTVNFSTRPRSQFRASA